MQNSFHCPNWTSLPAEVLLTILSFLDVADLLQCSRVNRSLRELVLDPVLHQYRKRDAIVSLQLYLSRRKTRAAISPPNAWIWLNKTQAMSRNICRSLTKITLSRHLESRPAVQDLIARAILPTFIHQMSPILVDKQCQIYKRTLRHNLERKLGRRPSRKSLIDLNILPEECRQPSISPGLIDTRRRVIKEGLKDGLRAWIENRGVAAQQRRSAEIDELERHTVLEMVRRFTARELDDNLQSRADSTATEKKRQQARWGRALQIQQQRDRRRSLCHDCGPHPTRAHVSSLKRFWESLRSASA